MRPQNELTMYKVALVFVGMLLGILLGSVIIKYL